MLAVVASSSLQELLLLVLPQLWTSFDQHSIPGNNLLLSSNRLNPPMGYSHVDPRSLSFQRGHSPLADARHRNRFLPKQLDFPRHRNVFIFIFISLFLLLFLFMDPLGPKGSDPSDRIHRHRERDREDRSKPTRPSPGEGGGPCSLILF